MKENALINIKSVITTGGEEDVVDLITTGSFYEKNGKYYIVYKESEATGFDGYTTTMKAWKDGVSITRFGDRPSTLVIEEGRANLCNYPTQFGNIILDINGIEVENKLSGNGGDLEFEYSLNTNGMLVSENVIRVNVKEI